LLATTGRGATDTGFAGWFIRLLSLLSSST
jgi:hypothetical protein